MAGPFQLDDSINLEAIHVGQASIGAIYDAAFNQGAGLLGRPLSNLTFIANQLIGGYEPFGYKLVNLTLHLMCGFLVLAVARRLVPLLAPTLDAHRQRWVAIGATALWLVHPLQVSTVLYAVQRMTQLATLFMLLAIYIALKRLARPAALPRARDGMLLALAAGLVSAVAVLCKENGILVPFLLLAIALSLPDVSRAISRDTRGKKMFWLLAVAVPVAGALLMAAFSMDWIAGRYAGRDFSLSERLLTEPFVLGGYLKSFFLPDLRTMGLFLDGTPTVTADNPWAWVGVASVFAALAGAWLLRRRMPFLAFATFWFLAAHLLESTFLPLELAFEHRNYLALLGLCLMLAAAVSRLSELARPRVAVLVAVVVLMTMAGLTFLRSSAWSDAYTFIHSEARHHPESIRAQAEAAVLDSLNGDNQAAVTRIRALQAAYPDAFFPTGMDIDLACAIPGYPTKWDAVLDRVRAEPLDANITSLHKTVALKILRGQCPGEIAVAFEAHLDRVIEVYRGVDMPAQVQFFLMIKADLQSTPEASRKVLHQAIEADPGNTAALYRLAYFELNAGNIDAAANAIASLRRRTPGWRPDSHRVAELEGFLVQARGDKSGANAR